MTISGSAAAKEKADRGVESSELESLLATARQVTAALQSKANEIIEISTSALAAKTQIADAQGVIATKSNHIQDAQEHADKVRGDLDRLFTTTSKSATEVDGIKARVQTAADSSSELLTGIRTTKGQAEIDAETVAKAKDSAKDSAAATKVLADKAAVVEERVAGYEKRLEELEAQCKGQLETIIGLLPGATSAGLAFAFDARRRTFLEPGKRWQWIFIGSILAIVFLALTGLWQVSSGSAELTFNKLALVWLARIPMAGALVWLAMHASRESALAKRLEEDYGFKATIAASFQGFVEQMAKLGKEDASNTPLGKLCEDTLKTIANPPGRIYEKHNLTVSPTSLVGEATSTMLKG